MKNIEKFENLAVNGIEIFKPFYFSENLVGSELTAKLRATDAGLPAVLLSRLEGMRVWPGAPAKSPRQEPPATPRHIPAVLSYRLQLCLGRAGLRSAALKDKDSVLIEQPATRASFLDLSAEQRVPREIQANRCEICVKLFIFV